MPLAKADFYYGALLSQLVNSGFAPAIIEKGESRRIYSLSNNYDDFRIYVKYNAKSVSNEKGNKRWDFSFNFDEALAILNDNTINLFAFVCGEENLKDSEIAFLSKDEVDKCFGKDYASPNRRITIRIDKKGSWNFTVYGTGLEVKENAFKITRNPEKRLQEFTNVAV